MGSDGEVKLLREPRPFLEGLTVKISASVNFDDPERPRKHGRLFEFTIHAADTEGSVGPAA